MNNKKLQFAIVGCGDISHTHANAMKYIDNARFSTCCDVAEEKAHYWKEKYQCDSAYTNLDEMLRNEKIDAVVLATWPIQHLEQIQAVLDKGIKNILCEKSMTLSGDEALKVYQLSKENNAFILEACKYRYHPVFTRIEKLINLGELGLIDNINTTFSNYEPDNSTGVELQNWRYKKECGGGVAYDWMSYLVNAANYLSGSKPKKVYASGSVSDKIGIITRLYGLIEYENGIVATISSSKNASFSQQLEIVCEKGRLISPVTWGVFGDVKIECHRRKEDWPYILTDIYEIEHKDSFVLQMEHFIDVMLNKNTSKILLTESVINIYTIEALVKSMNKGKEIEIDLPEKII